MEMAREKMQGGKAEHRPGFDTRPWRGLWKATAAGGEDEWSEPHSRLLMARRPLAGSIAGRGARGVAAFPLGKPDDPRERLVGVLGARDGEGEDQRCNRFLGETERGEYVGLCEARGDGVHERPLFRGDSCSAISRLSR